MTEFLDSIGYSAWVLHALLAAPARSASCRVLLGPGVGRPSATALARHRWSSSCSRSASGGRSTRRRARCQLVSNAPWIPSWGIRYRVGIDGISLMMVLLTTLLMPLSVLGSWTTSPSSERGFYALLLTLLTGHARRLRRARPLPVLRDLGSDAHPDVLHHRDLGRRNRLYAAIKFFIYTMVGSLLMLVAIIVPGLAGPGGHGLPDVLATTTCCSTPGRRRHAALWLFGAFVLAFADQGADVPVPHLAAGRARRGADRRAR